MARKRSTPPTPASGPAGRYLTTPNLGLPYPVPADPADVPADLEALAMAIDGLPLAVAQLTILAFSSLGATTSYAMPLSQAYDVNTDPTVFPARSAAVPGVTVAKPGWYAIVAYWNYSAGPTGVRFFQVFRNNDIIYNTNARTVADQTGQTSWGTQVGGACLARLAAGDSARLGAYHTDPVAGGIGAAAVPGGFTIARLGG